MLGVKGDKEIYIKNISSIQLKRAGIFANGYIQFSFLGGQEAKGGLVQAGRDENSIVFYQKKNQEFEEIKNMIEEKIVRKN